MQGRQSDAPLRLSSALSEPMEKVSEPRKRTSNALREVKLILTIEK